MGLKDQPVRAVAIVDWRTNMALSDRQILQLGNLRDAHDALMDAMHYADGTQPGAERFGSRHMAIAATQIELGVEMAYKAVLQQP